jgi:hypothetical protein
MREESLPERLIRILLQNRLLADGEQELLSISWLAADGSMRRFARITRGNEPLCLAVMPASADSREMAEAASAWHIGHHLQLRGVPVPRLLAREEDSGTILFEDLGDVRLHDLVAATDFSDERERSRLLATYRQVIDLLVVMQVEGADGFDARWCWDSPCYDRRLMLERESGYFLRAFWKDLLALDVPAGVESEFSAVADQASQAAGDFFLHRDFQCRNIMIKEGRVRFIDYQGGRRGPLGYDLASLLIDPYAALPDDFRSELFAYYLVVLGSRLKIDADLFRRQYAALALQRNLQIIGAFAFLSGARGKNFFAGYIRPAVEQLRERLRNPLFADLKNLRSMVEAALALLDKGSAAR